MKKYCLNCMKEIESGAFCADCVNLRVPEPAPHHLKPGTILNGKYLAGAVIGEGRFGITYIGRDLVLEKKIAIKEFYPAGHMNRNNETSNNLIIEGESQKEYVRRGIDGFLSDARNAVQFSEESGMAEIKDFFEENGTAYVVMEYLDGRTLASHINDVGAMSADKVFKLMMPVVQVLARMHKSGRIHGDISPDHIMYLNKGILKLFDFGSMCGTGAEQEPAGMIRRGYAAEEQYMGGGEQGPWTDVYGLCAVIYKCITGVTPVDAMERTYDVLRRPSELGARISRPLEDVLMYGLAQHAGNRCRSMEELLQFIQSGIEQSQSIEPGGSAQSGSYSGGQGGAQSGSYSRGQGSAQSGSYSGEQGGAQSYSYNGERGGAQSGGHKEPGGYGGAGSYGESGRYAEQNRYRGPGVPPNVPAGQNNHSKPKNKFLIPAIAGGVLIMVIIAMVFLLVLLPAKRGAVQVAAEGDYYVTGCKEVMKVREEEDKDSKVLTKLDNGEKVSLVEKRDGNYWKIYIEAEDVTGYIDHHYLTNESDAVMDPVTRYVKVKKGESLPILSTPDADGSSLGMAKRGEEVTILAQPGDVYSYIYSAEESAYGYVKSSALSEEKPSENASSSTKQSTSKKQTKSEVLGAGSPPSSYQGVYYVSVAKGYLALRNAKAFDTANEIGKMYNGDYIYAIKTNELYWYVYSPSLGAYGYTNSDYLVSSYGSVNFYNDYIYYADVDTGYLALRYERAFDSSNEIGKIADGQEVDVIDKSTGTYWYVYVPSLNQYGYVNSDYLKR